MGLGFDLAILYRGSLESCNYDCWYCPFAKAKDSAESLAVDQAGLERFVCWVENNQRRSLGILFTPWGEALVRDYYREAFVHLSNLSHVTRVVAQTNLSYPLDWLESANRGTAALWCSYHPSQTSRDRFIAQSTKLDELGVRHSIGMVGLKQDIPEIVAMRRQLAPKKTLWVNAYKRERDYYSDSDISLLESIDPHFPVNNTHHPSKNKSCSAGERAITVDENGDIHRCHFVGTTIGNLYTDDLDKVLQPRACPNDTCHCYIGYTHLDHLNQYKAFGPGLLERIPPRTQGPNPGTSGATAR